MRRDIPLSPLTPCFDEPSFLPTSVLPDVPLSILTPQTDVPEHVRVLFLTTLQEANLSPTEMLAAGVIEPSYSPWASLVCLAKKPDGSYRFCVDYRRVNAVSRKDTYPIPDIQDAFDSLRGGGIGK